MIGPGSMSGLTKEETERRFREHMRQHWERILGVRNQQWLNLRDDHGWTQEHEVGRGEPPLLTPAEQERVHERFVRSIDVVRSSIAIVLTEQPAEESAQSVYVHWEPLVGMVFALGAVDREAVLFTHYERWNALSDEFLASQKRIGERLARGELAEAVLTCIDEACALWKLIEARPKLVPG